MPKYSCVIGGCPQKTWNHAVGVEFYRLKYVTDGELKAGWREKILSSRKDLKKGQINDVAVCSLHFVNGDKNSLPVIKPKIVDGVVVYSQPSLTERTARHTLDSHPDHQETQETQEYDEPDSDSQSFGKKLLRVQQVFNASPDPVVKSIEKRRGEEFQNMASPVKKVYRALFPEPANKSPPLAVKLNNLIENPGIVDDIDDQENMLKTDKIILKQSEIIKESEAEIARLKKALSVKNHCIERFMGDQVDMKFYTGLPDYMTFLALRDLLEPARHRLSSLYYTLKEKDDSYVDNRGRHHSLSIENQLFLVLNRLRLGLLEKDLGHRFDISDGTVSDIFSKWICHMSHVFRQLPISPSRDLVDRCLPKVFKDLDYDKTRCIVDCTEIFVEQPSNLVLQSITWSSYKNHNTVKGLVGILPHGPICFLSELYAGSATDYDITEDCGIVDLIDYDDTVMADKGFEIQPLLDAKKARIDIPPVLGGVDQMSLEQETDTRRIARLRVHVERAIERIKDFQILNGTVAYSLIRLLPDIWIVCGHLTNFLPPLISED